MDIKNIIFDLGNVLIKFNPVDYLVKEFGYDLEKCHKLYKHIFDSEEWMLLDKGTLSIPEAIERIELRIPQYSSDIRRILRYWEYFIPEEIYTTSYFLRLFKSRGYKIYALSNFQEKAFNYLLDKYNFFKEFDGMVVSYECKSVKPEPEIFEILIDRYSIKPEKSVFIDDLSKNIQVAEKMNFRVIHFTHPDKLMRLYSILESKG